MKAVKETVRKYFKQIFEQSTAGEYSVNLTNTEYLVELYGAGGGCANGTWLTDTGYCGTAGGGSGAGYKGIITLPTGSYTVTVGAAGTDKLNGINERNQVAQAGTGGSTSISNLIICRGGVGGYSYYGNITLGTGGTVTISSSLEEIKVLNSVIGNSNGTSAGGARTWGPLNCNGATSVYDNTLTGYGAGGGYPTGAEDGYCKIYILSNESDYDIYEDVTTYKLIKETTRNYYKYQEQSWTQPYMTAEVPVGGSEFGCEASTTYSTAYPYKAFDGNSNNAGTVWKSALSNTNPQWITFYNPNQLKVTSLVIYNYYNTADGYGYFYIKKAVIQGSNDNNTWTDLKTVTSNSWVRSITVDMSDNTSFYKYYRIYIEERAYYNATYSEAIILEVEITAIQRTVIAGTSSDYDFYIDTDTYKAVKF